jgi:hypothetical protein
MMRYLFLVVITALFSSPVNATTYWASTSGGAGSCGAASGTSDPGVYRTLSQGINCLASGDTLMLKNGTYTTSLEAVSIIAGTAGAYTTIRAENSRGATLKPASGNFVISLETSNEHHIEFRGIIIDGSGGCCTASTMVKITWSGAGTSNHAHHIRFVDMEFTSNLGANSVTGILGGTDGGNASGFEVYDSYFHDMGYGIYWGGSGAIIERNRFITGTGYALHIYCDSGCDTSGVVIRNNFIKNFGTGSNCTGGMVFASGTGASIFNNIIRDQGGSCGIGIQLFGNSGSAEVYNNTMYSNNGACIDVNSGHQNATLKNNLCIQNGSGITNSGTGTTQSNNITTGTAGDHFINVGADNFQLVSTSSARDAGIDVGLPYKGSAPDVGYAEYGNTYWVSITGGSTGNCTTAITSADPGTYLRSIGAAINCTPQPGDTIYVKDSGIYTDAISWVNYNIPNGTPGNPITLASAPGNTTKPIWRSAGPVGNTSESHWNTYTNGASYWTFDGFVIDGNNRTTLGDYNNGMRFESDGSKPITGVVLRNMRFQNMGANCVSFGVYTVNDGYHIIEDSEFDGCGQDFNNSLGPGYGMYGAGNYSIIQRSLFRGIGGYAVHLDNNDWPFTGVTVRWNRFLDNNQSLGSGLPYDRQEGALRSTRGTVYVYGNEFINERCEAIGIGGWGGDAEIYNNTMDNVASHGACSHSVAFWDQGTADRSYFKNNLTTRSEGLNFTPAGARTSNNIASSTPSDFYTDVANLNFTLRQGANTAVDSGANLGSPYNIDKGGTSRPQGSAWDIGAWERGSGGSPSCPAPALVASYSADNTANDGSGANHGSLGSGVTYAAGKYNQAFTFAGLGGVSIADANPLDFSLGFSLGAWVKPSSVSGTSAVVAKNPDSKYFLFSSIPGYCGANGIMGGFSQGGTTYWACHTSPATVDTWQYLEVSYAPPTISLRRDGVLLGTAAASATLDPSAGSLQLGTSGFNEHFSGQIDNVRLYNCGISLAQHISDMNTPLGTLTSPVGLKLSGVGRKIGPGVSIKVGGQ